MKLIVIISQAMLQSLHQIGTALLAALTCAPAHFTTPVYFGLTPIKVRALIDLIGSILAILKSSL